MRKPRHFSPTSYALWRSDQQEYYRRYLSERRFAKEPQSFPMAIGSSFDWFVKSHLNSCLGSKLGVKGELGALEKQVEAHNLPEAKTVGEAVMKAYTDSGALDALKREIVCEARFEFGITARFAIRDRLLIETRERDPECVLDGLFLNGRPDGFFYTRAAHNTPLVPVILDWKVNSWQSAQKSPDPGFIAVHDVTGKVAGPHKDAYVAYHEGLKVNKSKALNEEWRMQLSIYSWVLGVPIGTTIVGSIDQVIGPCFKPRVAKHRFIIDGESQWKLFDDICAAWEIVNSDHIFRDVSKEESVARCVMLENQVVFDEVPVSGAQDDLNFDWR